MVFAVSLPGLGNEMGPLNHQVANNAVVNGPVLVGGFVDDHNTSVVIAEASTFLRIDISSLIALSCTEGDILTLG